MQKKHLYNSKFGKINWFIDRFGAKEVVLKPCRSLFAPLIIPLLGKAYFDFRGQRFDHFYHGYNMTWVSERGVEIPIARHFLSTATSSATLEIGNVLSHYGPVHHDILDKFEKAPGVINEDIVEFKPQKKYDLIISISTFEHIGFDDDSTGSSAAKILEALQVTRGLLSKEGRLVITVPISYNPELNQLIRDRSLGNDNESYLRRFGIRDWRECSRDEALACEYKQPYPYANAIMVAEFTSL